MTSTTNYSSGVEKRLHHRYRRLIELITGRNPPSAINFCITQITYDHMIALNILPSGDLRFFDLLISSSSTSGMFWRMCIAFLPAKVSVFLKTRKQSSTTKSRGRGMDGGEGDYVVRNHKLVAQHNESTNCTFMLQLFNDQSHTFVVPQSLSKLGSHQILNSLQWVQDFCGQSYKNLETNKKLAPE